MNRIISCISVVLVLMGMAAERLLEAVDGVLDGDSGARYAVAMTAAIGVLLISYAVARQVL